MIEEGVKRLVKGPNFGTITTLMPDGSPATHVMWIDADDEHVLINTETGRAKFRNVQRDPRVSVTIWNEDDPYDYVEVRGVVEDVVTGPEARAHIDHLSEKYTGGPYKNAIQTERVILKIRPVRQRT
ncbi:MAG TPA: PPOX class F420-dependent oxidoreductase [Actinomycetota bacterium]|nr:PPOX class F420-dependent oxidoreductase [Actinomycetota bacterium]